MIVCLFFKKKVLKIEEYCSTSNRYWLPWSYNDSSQLSAINAKELYFLKEI